VEEVLNEFDGIMTIEVFKELGEGIGNMRLEKEDIIDKMQSKTRSLNSRMKEAQKQVSVGARQVPMAVFERPSLWLRFNNDIFLLWPHNPYSLT
jgi:hypothetical protein